MNISPMVQTHPLPAPTDMHIFTECIDACFECAYTCNSCADACLGEDNVQELIQCIRLNMDCADICAATGRTVSRMTEPQMEVIRAQVQACAEVCRLCAEECARHAQHHEHCRVCAEACRRCEQACHQLLDNLAA